MLKAILIILAVLVLIPVCALAGYGIGHLIAPFYFDDFHDRDLAAAIYGMPLIGFPLYIISMFVLWRMARSR
ncbi:MAG: hypothetical protein ACRECW_12565 [Phyllobacterium sp.]